MIIVGHLLRGSLSRVTRHLTTGAIRSTRCSGWSVRIRRPTSVTARDRRFAKAIVVRHHRWLRRPKARRDEPERILQLKTFSTNEDPAVFVVVKCVCRGEGLAYCATPWQASTST